MSVWLNTSFLCLLQILNLVTGDFLEPKERIVNGKEAQPKQFPWYVYFQLEDGYSCGGAIISDLWIVTTVTCVFQQPSFVLKFGLIDLNEEAKVTMVPTEVIQHPDANYNTDENDIALLKLPEKLNFSDFIKPMQIMPSDCLGVQLFPKVTVSGFGYTSPDANKDSQHLLYADLQTIGNEECSDKYRYGKVDGDTQFCAISENGTSTVPCDNDTGDPAVSTIDGDEFLVGVFSYSNSDCEDPSGFTRISAYLDWIKNHTGVEPGVLHGPAATLCNEETTTTEATTTTTEATTTTTEATTTTTEATTTTTEATTTTTEATTTTTEATTTTTEATTSTTEATTTTTEPTTTTTEATTTTTEPTTTTTEATTTTTKATTTTTEASTTTTTTEIPEPEACMHPLFPPDYNSDQPTVESNSDEQNNGQTGGHVGGHIGVQGGFNLFG